MPHQRGDYIYHPASTPEIERELKNRIKNVKTKLDKKSKVWKRKEEWEVMLYLIRTSLSELEECNRLIDILEGRANAKKGR